MLQRSQVLLDQSQIVDLASLANAKGISVSKLVRKYLQDGIEVDKTKNADKNKGLSSKQRLLKTVKKIRSLKLSKAPSDAALNHDHYLYGAARKYGSS